jgi:hypothetical protein
MRASATSDLAAKGIAGNLDAARKQEAAGPDAGWRGDHRRHHQLHQHLQPAQRDRRRLLARNANALGLTRKPWVKSSLAPGSKAVALYLEEAGLLGELEALGFGIVAFACTTCNGMSGALDPKIQQEIIDRDLYATAVLSGNRNFDGRIHPYAKQAFLASPPLVVAYAIAGTVRFDIEKDSFGNDANGKFISRTSGRPMRKSTPSWPEREAGAVPQGLHPDVRARHHRRACQPQYDWRPQSTYIRRPPYWEGALAGERTLKGMRPLALLPDNITTDHLSPSNAILLDSAPANTCEDGPAGRGLQLLRHPPRRSPDRAARHLRQPATGQRDGGGRWQGEEGFAGARRAGRQGACACGKRSKPT